MNIGTDMEIDLVSESGETSNYVGREENSKNYSVPIYGNYFKDLIKSMGHSHYKSLPLCFEFHLPQLSGEKVSFIIAYFK